LATKVTSELVHGRYRVEARLGAGAQGTVYRVRDEIAGRTLALKIVDGADRRQLSDEFAQLVSIRHPGIARAVDLDVLTQPALGHPAGSAFFTSELVMGAALGPPPPSIDPNRWLGRVAVALLQALDALHRAGLVHADIKPDHVVVAEDGPVLVDFGLSGAPAPVRGTLPFMAPEVLTGVVGPASDLYALGATLYASATGERPFVGTTVAELTERICRGERAAAKTRAPWLDPRLADLIEGLLQIDLEKRPRSAAAALRTLRPLIEELGLDADDLAPLTPPLCGRAGEVSALVAALRSLVAGDLRAVVVAGAPGSGRRTLIDIARRHYQLLAAAGEVAPIHFRRANLDRAELGDGASCHQAVDRVVAALRAEPAVWIFDRPDELSLAVLRAIAADPEVACSPVLVVADDEPIEVEDGIAVLAVPPLADHEARELIAHLLPEASLAEVEAIAAAGAGNPALLIERCRAAGDAGSSYRDLISAQLAGERAALGQLAVVLACAERPLAFGEACELVGLEPVQVRPLLAALEQRGWIHREGDEVELRSLDLGEALREGAPAESRRRAYRALADTETPGWRRARYRLGCGQPVSPADVGGACAALRGTGRLGQALALARLGLAQAAPGDRPAIAETCAELAVVAGAYDEAIAIVEAHGASADPERAHRLALLEADAIRRSGDKQAAHDLLAAELGKRADAATRARLARVLVDLGRHREVIDLLPSPEIGPEREALGLAHLYLGQLEAAFGEFRGAEAMARKQADPVALARALGLQGMVAQAQGAIVEAARLYEKAARSAREGGDVHALAVYLLNRATADYERGHFASAMESALRARRQFARLGPVAERAAAEYNLGLAALGLGDLATAETCAIRAAQVAARHGNEQMRAYAEVLRGDLDRRRGHHEAASLHYTSAIDIARGAGLERDEAAMRRNLAECLAALGRADARDALASERDLGSEDERDRLRLTRARVELELGGEPPAHDDVAAIAERARSSGREDLAWRADLVAARLAYAEGASDVARTCARRARSGFESISSQAPELSRAGLVTDPDQLALVTLEASLGEADTTAPADLERLRRLLSLSRQLNSELRLQPLLEQVIDAAAELTRAERAMLVLKGAPGELEVVTARNDGQRRAAIDDAGANLSRAIVDRAVVYGEVVVTAHAESDERFDASASVAAMGLRSVLAVPLRAKRDILGALYLDHRFRRDAFDDGAVATVRELADIAGVAIGNARLVDENRRREREIAELNARLQQEVETTRGALDDALAKLATESERRLRHDYDSIIGRSKVMLELLQLVDRATDSDLPVVIHGESGTGKELVARALHGNGSRREGTFVAVNCGALPEPLLESELFGHARGAFTGAARDRRGLFEVADGGTLFLDELADTSLAMQAKLLRVLQEGELRRVGDDRVRKVNVRIVAATNRPLESLVEAGSFREDLYYRVNVVSVRMPPLRERSEDIPALCEHFLARLQSQPTLTAEAQDLLQRYSWPGNVRELENELARAAALSSGTITAADLSARLRSGPATATTSASDLELRPQVESLERELLGRALEATGGNQSRAAKLLGLSRFGLQKKLKRYGMSPEDVS